MEERIKIQKYHNFLSELNTETRYPKQMGMSAFCKKHGMPASSGAVLKSGGIIRNIGTDLKPIYEWNTITPSLDMANEFMKRMYSYQQKYIPKPKRDYKKYNRREDELFDLLPNKFTTARAKKAYVKMGYSNLSKSNIYYAISKLIDQGRVKKLAYASYMKISEPTNPIEKKVVKQTVQVEQPEIRQPKRSVLRIPFLSISIKVKYLEFNITE